MCESEKSMAQKLKELLDNISEEETAEMKEFFRDKKPKGWLNIEEYLPKMYGKEFESPLSDHNVWYYEAKKLGITHWFND
jgi:hypothetical protein